MNIQRRARQEEAPSLLLFTSLGQFLQIPHLADRLAPQSETVVVNTVITLRRPGLHCDSVAGDCRKVMVP